METYSNKICPQCRVHTKMYKELIGNGRSSLICSECGCCIILDMNGKEIPHERLIEEKNEWA